MSSLVGESHSENYLNDVHPDDRELVNRKVSECIATGRPYDYIYRAYRSDGELLHLRINGRSVVDSHGNTIALKGTCQDVSAIVKQQQKLEKAMQEANQAVEAKARFLANMSHEIRTPLNGLLGYAELLNTTSLDSQQAEYLAILRNAGEHLLGVVNDILDYSKIESGKIQIERQAFNLATKIDSLIAIHRPLAVAKGLDISAEIGADVPAVISSDEFRFAQILSNLISNALKFTQTGSVKVQALVKEKNLSNLVIELAVIDTGIGISTGDQRMLFKTFSQVDSSISRKYGGTGLGLVIAKKLSCLLGGDLWFASSYGQGSSFHFSISTPLVILTNASYEADLSSKAQTRNGAKVPLSYRILIVEDNPINQQLARSFLRKLGYEADLVANGKEALLAQEREPYNLMFMDMQMPEMDGLEATRQLREHWQSDVLKIIAMTANALESDRQICLDAGMDGFISKPFSKADIALALQQLGQQPGMDKRKSQS